MSIKYKFRNPEGCYFVTFVEKAEDWIYSSAGDYYCNRKGLIELSYV